MNITELLKSKGITYTPAQIYKMGEQFKTSHVEGAKIFRVTEEEYWKIKDQGLEDYKQMMADRNFRVGKLHADKLKGANFPAQAEALLIARGARTYFELSELTGIPDSRIQRICKGQSVAYFYEILLIQKATGHDIGAHTEAMLQEINKMKEN